MSEEGTECTLMTTGPGSRAGEVQAEATADPSFKTIHPVQMRKIKAQKRRMKNLSENNKSIKLLREICPEVTRMSEAKEVRRF